MRYAIEFDNGSGRWSMPANYLASEPAGTVGRRRVNEAEWPSLAAAQREAAAQQAGGTHPYRARDTQPELAIPEQEGASMEQPATQGRTIRLYRRNSRWVVDSGGREVPGMTSLTPYLPAGLKGTRFQYSTVESALAGGISPQILSAALSAWYVEHPNVGGEPVVTEGITELPDTNAYLSLGDDIYKMVPVRRVSAGKAIRLMREKIRIEAERTRASLTARASQEAQQLIGQAQTRATLIQQEAEKALAAAQRGLSFPEWLLGETVKGTPEAKYVLKELSISIKEITHHSRVWKAAPYSPVPVKLWLPLSGVVTTVHMFDTASGVLPHVTRYSACMTLGEETKELCGREDLIRLSNQVSRALSVINLASLLNCDYTRWLPDVQKALPQPIKEWLTSHPTQPYQEAGVGLPPQDRTEEGVATWGVR